jgi:hypothetical protein
MVCIQNKYYLKIINVLLDGGITKCEVTIPFLRAVIAQSV